MVGRGRFWGVFRPFHSRKWEESAAASEKEAFLPQSEAGRAGMWLQELSLGKEKT